jgi:hypothetical protein
MRAVRADGGVELHRVAVKKDASGGTANRRRRAAGTS